jgi:hypothetical protein
MRRAGEKWNTVMRKRERAAGEVECGGKGLG